MTAQLAARDSIVSQMRPRAVVAGVGIGRTGGEFHVTVHLREYSAEAAERIAHLVAHVPVRVPPYSSRVTAV